VKKPMVVTGLDIGSSKIAAVTSAVSSDGHIDILAHATGDAFGIAGGMLANLNHSIDSVSKVLTKLRSKLSKKPDEIYVNIGATDVKGARSMGMIPIALRGREIVKSDIDKSVDAASTIHLPFDREIIHKIVHSFSIDDQPWIKNPLGLYASRLACEVYVITANVNHIQSIYKCVNDAGYDVKGIAFTGIADGMSLLDRETKESGAVLIDIGSSLTEVSVFIGGCLDSFDIFRFGSKDAGNDFRSITAFNDIISAIGIKLSVLNKAASGDVSIILAGGFSLADGMIEFLEEKFAHPVKMGTLKLVRGDMSGLESIRLATAIGLCAYAYEVKASLETRLDKRLFAKVEEIFNNYF